MRIAHLLGMINAFEYEVLTTIKTAMPVHELLRHAAPADIDAFTSTILRIVKDGLITLEQPPRDETTGLASTTIKWERATFYC